MPQMGVLEIHPWGSVIEQVDYPDILIFDLDPAPELAWSKVVKAAFELREYLKNYQLKSFVKTTGGKGLHAVVPITPDNDWDTIKQFSQVFVDYIVMNHPNEYVGKMSKAKRKGKIYVDYLRNQRGATAIAPYSTRARPGAPVAAPVHWDELTKNYKDTYYDIFSLPNRLTKLRKDPWKDFFNTTQSLRLDEL